MRAARYFIPAPIGSTVTVRDRVAADLRMGRRIQLRLLATGNDWHPLPAAEGQSIAMVIKKIYPSTCDAGTGINDPGYWVVFSLALSV